MADYVDAPEALVVEAVFEDARTAIGNRLEMRFQRFGRLLTPLLTWQIRPLLGFDPSTLSPVRAAAGLKLRSSSCMAQTISALVHRKRRQSMQR